MKIEKFMLTVVAVLLGGILLLIINIAVVSINKSIEEQENAYKKAEYFVDECIKKNGVYSESQISRKVRKMICSFPFDNPNPNI